MRRILVLAGILLAASAVYAAPPETQGGWRERVNEAMPLMGHRNWILVVDSAYPLQVSPGVETIETNAGQIEVVQYVLRAMGRSIHVRPNIFMDAELKYVPDEDAPGASGYRAEIADLLRSYGVQTLPHARLIANVDEAGKQFHVLVLKTSMTVPYSSVFLQLDCKYWSAEAEKRMRAMMPDGQR